MSNNFRLVLLALAVMVSSRGVAYVADALPGQNVQASPDQKAKVAYELPPHLQRPFVSTYYVQPKVKVGEPVRIGYDHCRLKNFKTSSIGRVTYRDCELENCEPPTDCLSRAERQALEKAKRKASAEEKAKQDDLKKQKNNTKTK